MDDELDLRDYLAVVWRRRGLVVAFVLIAVGMAVAYVAVTPSVFEAEAIIELSESSGSGYANPASAVQVLTSPEMMTAATRTWSSRLPRPTPDVSAQAIRDTRMVRVRVRSRNAGEAARLADAISSTFVDRASERVYDKRKILVERLDTVSKQTAELASLQQENVRVLRGARSPALQDDTRALAGFLALSSMSTSMTLLNQLRDSREALSTQLVTLELPSIIRAPSLPISPVAPRKGMIFSMALLAGGTAGILAAFLVDFLPKTERVRSANPS